MFQRTKCLLLLLAIGGPVLAQAQGAEEEAKGPWFGNVKFGYLATSGNTDNSNLNTSFQVGYGAGKWVHTFDAFAIHATEDEATTAESYELGWKSERSLSEKDFLFGRLNWRNDRFSGYEEQFSQSVGYGRRLIDAAPHTLNAEIGAGARQSERTDGLKENDLILRGGLDYKWQFSETAAFTQDFVVESGEDNTYFESVTAIAARLVGDLALVASYTIKNNSVVPAGTDNTDTYTAISLEYAF